MVFLSGIFLGGFPEMNKKGGLIGSLHSHQFTS